MDIDKAHMTLTDRIAALTALGSVLQTRSVANDWGDLGFMQAARRENGWFTMENVALSYGSIGWALEQGRLEAFVRGYAGALADRAAPTLPVGVVTAGNIPLAGAFDLVYLWLAGYRGLLRCSSTNTALFKQLLVDMAAISPKMAGQITLADRLDQDMAGVLASGSDETMALLGSYCNAPVLGRGHSNGVAILDGTETEAALGLLGQDVFAHFGLGCRSVAGLLVPEGYCMDGLVAAWTGHAGVLDHGKYHQNYIYQRALLEMQQGVWQDLGGVLAQQHAGIDSPIGVVYYSHYGAIAEAYEQVANWGSRCQVVVSARSGDCPFGGAQRPDLGNYANGLDVMAFLLDL